MWTKIETYYSYYLQRFTDGDVHQQRPLEQRELDTAALVLWVVLTERTPTAVVALNNRVVLATLS